MKMVYIACVKRGLDDVRRPDRNAMAAMRLKYLLILCVEQQISQ